jgi:hypothetical protein
MKSWVGKHVAADTPLHQALKAMLVEDVGRAVMVSVPAETPKAVPAAVVVPPARSPVGENVFPPDMIERSVKAALDSVKTQSALNVTINQDGPTTTVAELLARLEALEKKAVTQPTKAPEANPAWKKVPACFVRDVTAGGQDPVNPQILALPDIRQKDYYSCGAAASMAVARGFFGVGPEDLNAWKTALGTTIERSTHPERIVEYLKSLGLDAVGRDNMSVADLRAAWLKGYPVICPVQDYGPDVPAEAEFNYGHYLAVVGVTLGYVFCQDSSDSNVQAESGTIDALGKIMVAEADWVKAWHDRDADGNKFVCYGITVGRKGDLDDLVPPPAAEPEEPTKKAPHGAKALQKLHKMYAGAMEHCSEQGDLNEHPKVKAFLGEHKDLMCSAAGAVHKFARKHYPDHFPEADGKAAETPEVKVAPVVQEPTETLEASPSPWTPEALAKLADAARQLAVAQATVAAQQYRLTGKR